MGLVHGTSSAGAERLCRCGELKACFLKVEMLYEEALYTVLHRAGTMGPDQVDDEEVLLNYLQQVSKAPPTHPASLWGGHTHTHTLVPVSPR